ncbi:hypothetical protein Dimus_008440 [Dionaea muscipula]
MAGKRGRARKVQVLHRGSVVAPGGEQVTEKELPVGGEKEAVAVAKGSSDPSELQIGECAEGLRKLGRWGDEIELQVDEGEELVKGGKSGSRILSKSQEGMGLPTRFAVLSMGSGEGAVYHENMQGTSLVPSDQLDFEVIDEGPKLPHQASCVLDGDFSGKDAVLRGVLRDVCLPLPRSNWRQWMLRVTKGKTHLASSRRKCLAVAVYYLWNERNCRVFHISAKSPVQKCGWSLAWVAVLIGVGEFVCRLVFPGHGTTIRLWFPGAAVHLHVPHMGI